MNVSFRSADGDVFNTSMRVVDVDTPIFEVVNSTMVNTVHNETGNAGNNFSSLTMGNSSKGQSMDDGNDIYFGMLTDDVLELAGNNGALSYLQIDNSSKERSIDDKIGIDLADEPLELQGNNLILSSLEIDDYSQQSSNIDNGYNFVADFDCVIPITFPFIHKNKISGHSTLKIFAHSKKRVLRTKQNKFVFLHLSGYSIYFPLANHKVS